MGQVRWMPRQKAVMRSRLRSSTAVIMLHTSGRPGEGMVVKPSRCSSCGGGDRAEGA